MTGARAVSRTDQRFETIPAMAAAAARDFGDRLAITDGDTNLSYAELFDRSSTFAAALVASGIQPGDRVAIWTCNSVEWVVERPGISSGLATLSNYVADAFTSAEAWNYTAKAPSIYNPGTQPTGTGYDLTMLDNNGKPISTPVLGGPNDLWFHDEGSAR